MGRLPAATLASVDIPLYTNRMTSALPTGPAWSTVGAAAHSLQAVGGHDETVVLRNLVAMCSNLSVLSAQSTDLTTITEVFAASVESGAVVLDRGLNVLAHARIGDPDDIVKHLREHAGTSTLNLVLTAVARNRRALTVPANKGGGESVAIAPVSVGSDVVGYLLVMSSHANDMSEDMRLLATEHAAMVCGVVLGRGLVLAAAAGQARRHLIEALLLSRDRDDGEVDRLAVHLGFDRSRQHYVMAVAAAGAQVGSGPSPVESLLTRLAPDAIVTARTDEVVAIVPSNGATSVAEQGRVLARACMAAAGRRHRIAAIGIGGSCAAPAEIGRSYVEARKALAAGERMGESNPITAFAELGIHRLLLRIPDMEDLRSFAEEVIGSLLEEDRSAGTEYVATLAAYFGQNSSPRRAAQRLHVHANTVSYRVRRVEEITGLSLDSHRDRLMAEVAVEIIAGLGSGS